MTNELKIINRDGVLLADSREVAAMVEKDHAKLIRDIRTYCEYLNEANFGLVDFFIESAYLDSKGEERPCYLITRKGCDMVANKMTGAKGVLFTAAYVTKFEEMESALKTPQLPTDYLTALKALVRSEEEKKLLSFETEQQKQLILELQPKADYVDTILKNPGIVTITQISKDYGMTGTEMNKLLHDKGVQYKQSGQWLLYKKYHGMGYTHSETTPIIRSDGRAGVKMNTKWTQNGRLFIYNLLKQYGIYPLIEQDALFDCKVGA